MFGPCVLGSGPYTKFITQGPGLLRNFHVKIHYNYQRFLNLAPDWLAAQSPTNHKLRHIILVKWHGSLHRFYLVTPSLGRWNKLCWHKRHIHTKIWCGHDGVLDDMILFVIFTCLASNVYFNCIVLDFIYDNIDIKTMWHCALVSGTPSQSLWLFWDVHCSTHRTTLEADEKIQLIWFNINVRETQKFPTAHFPPYSAVAIMFSS